MNLYRLDTPRGPVRDLLGPVLIHNASAARRRAKAVAASRETAVTVSRITGAGAIRPMYTVHPNGSSTRDPR